MHGLPPILDHSAQRVARAMIASQFRHFAGLKGSQTRRRMMTVDDDDDVSEQHTSSSTCFLHSVMLCYPMQPDTEHNNTVSQQQSEYGSDNRCVVCVCSSSSMDGEIPQTRRARLSNIPWCAFMLLYPHCHYNVEQS